jgi:DNA helicase-2/ATP-dependent DNA helicase PcrA
LFWGFQFDWLFATLGGAELWHEKPPMGFLSAQSMRRENSSMKGNPFQGENGAFKTGLNVLKFFHMSLFSDSNKAQLAAITHGEGPQLIVAGAGTGKTRVITARIAWLILEKNLKVDEILALTFTEKAAGEMEERVDQLLPYGYVDLWISTFHAFCDKLLKRHALDIGLSNNYKLLDGTEAWLLVRKNLDKFNLDYYRPLGNPAKFIHALLKHFSRCKDEGIYPEDYLRYAEEIKLNNDSADFVKQLEIDLEDLDEESRREVLKQEILRIDEVANAYHVYQSLLRDNDCMDFADLINQTIRLLKERPLVLEKYRKQFKYILVDEFQDTNFVQYELIKLLAAPKNNLTVVGDDDQSIYKFRGASISNIMQFKDDFPTSENVVLTENYRSAQQILDLSYNFIAQNNPNRLEVKLGIDKKLKSNKDESGVVVHLHEPTVEDEARSVIERIIAIHAETNCSWSDFAILIRANDSANLFLQYMEEAGMPYQFLALRGLYSKTIVVDIINYFKLLDNYHESAAAFRMLNLPFLEIPPDQIVKLVHFAKRKALPLFEVMKIAGTVPEMTRETVSTVQRLVSQIEKDTALAKNKKPSEILRSFISNSGYLKYISNDSASARESMMHLNQYLKKMQAIESEAPDSRISDFLEIMKMEIEAGETGSLAVDENAGPELVKILTVHSAKGLEFDYVFIVNLVDRKFPTDARHEALDIPNALIREKIPEGNFHLEEERRLFYVAMTRARKALYFTSADDYGGAREKKLSRFLVELGFAKPEDVGKDVNKFAKVEKSEIVPEFIYEIPKKFSFSQMQTYESCPLRYKFSNVLKIPTFGSPQLTFGTVVHNTLQRFLEECFNVAGAIQPDLFGQKKLPGEQLLPLKRLWEIYDQTWSDDWYKDKEQKEKYYKKGKDILKSFHEDFAANKPKVKFLEQTFTLKVGEYTFTGRIDRVDDVGDVVEIVDYKTGRPKDENLSADDKKQLLFYQIAAEDVLKLKLQNLTYYYLEGGKKVSFLGKEKDKDWLKQKFLENIAAIKAQKFEATPGPHVCPYCDYRDICEYRKM